jgi:hypothetical protein
MHREQVITINAKKRRSGGDVCEWAHGPKTILEPRHPTLTKPTGKDLSAYHSNVREFRSGLLSYSALERR